MNVLQVINSTVWAMLPSEYNKMHAIVTRHSSEIDRALIEMSREGANRYVPNFTGAKLQITSDGVVNPENLLAARGERMAGTRYVQVRDGVAVIDIHGVIAMRMNMFEELCEGGTSTEMLARDFKTCLDSPDIKSIVLLIHSPGGEAFGTHEFASMVYAARGVKPLKAYISGYGCSAALFIAAGCDEIICDAQAMVGSIGVVSEWQDATEMYKNFGIDRRVVTSSNAPKKRLDLNKQEDMDEFIANLDAMENVFIKFMAKARGKTVEQVKTEFGQGGVLIGKDAVKVGMVSRLGSLEGVISELQRKPRNQNTAKQAANLTGDEIDMNLMEAIKTIAQNAGFTVTEAEQTKPANSVLGLEETEEPATAQTSAPATTNKPANDDLTEKVKQITVQATTDAGVFAAAQIKAGKVLPTEKADLVETLVQAALDDSVAPLASGETRVGKIKAQTEKRKTNFLTEETINSEANHILLAGTENNDDAEKKNKLLASTSLGKRTLQLKK